MEQNVIISTANNLETWGYLLLFLYSLGGGYVGIIAAGVLSAFGKMDISISIIVAASGNITGSSAFVYLARYQKNDIMKYFKKHRRKVALVHIWLKRYGARLIFFNKYIYGMKTIVPLAIGLSKYDIKKFLILNLIACVLWAIISGFLGFYSSKAILSVFDTIGNYPFIMPAFFVLLIGSIYILIKKVSKRYER